MLSAAKKDLAFRVETSLTTARFHGAWPMHKEIDPCIKMQSLTRMVAAWTEKQIEEWAAWTENGGVVPGSVPAPSHVKELIHRAKNLA